MGFVPAARPRRRRPAGGGRDSWWEDAIGYATSPDGVTWTKHPANPVLSLGAPGSPDEVVAGTWSVLAEDGTFRAWYNACATRCAVGYASGPLPFEEPPLLLNGGRFLVESMWWTADGGFGYGDPYPLTDDSGAFTFFDPANLEILVKVLDGCAINQRTWVFAAGLTNVGVTLTMTDTATGAQKIYNNTLGDPFAPIQDTDAFALCD